MKPADACAAVNCIRLSCNNLLHEHITSMVQHLAYFSSLVQIDVSSNPRLSNSGLATLLSAFSGMLKFHLIM
jgi:hypothetical protein